MKRVNEALTGDLAKVIADNESLRAQLVAANKDRGAMGKEIDRLKALCLRVSMGLQTGLDSENCQELGRKVIESRRALEQAL